MASYEDLAPELSKIVNQAEAENFAENEIAAPTPAEPVQVQDLPEWVIPKLKLWLKWFGKQRRPGFAQNDGNAEAGVPSTFKFLNFSPAEVARRTGMSKPYVLSLLAQVRGVIAEKRAYGDDAFEAHPDINIVLLDTPSEGDITINGTDLASVAGGVSGVTFNRPGGGNVNRSKAQIEAAGGSVGEFDVIVAAGTIPTALAAGDEITVTADGHESGAYVTPGLGE